MEQNYVLNLLFEIEKTEINEYCNQKINKIGYGALGVYELKSLNLIVLKLGDWQYSLNKELPVMTQQKTKQKIYIFPKQNGQYGIVLHSDTQQDLIDCFESVLYNSSNLIIPDEDAMRIQQESNLQQQVNKLPEKKPNEKSIEEKKKQTTSQKIGEFLSKGGDYIKKGLIAGGEYIGNGIVKGGKYFSTKIKKPKPINIKPETMAKVKMAKVGSNAVLTYTKGQIQSLIQAGKAACESLGEEFEKSETGQKIVKNKNYEGVKNVAKGTVHAVVAVYDGMYEALCKVGKGIQKASSDIVTEKYGQQAGQVVNDGFDTVGNVGQVMRVYKNEFVKEIDKDTKAQVQKEPSKQIQNK